jgi:hypothetical protein
MTRSLVSIKGPHLVDRRLASLHEKMNSVTSQVGQQTSLLLASLTFFPRATNLGARAGRRASAFGRNSAKSGTRRTAFY